ncbi:MAG: hypothetical protein QXX84_09015, partial [Sulfolobales archaeon]
MVRGLSKISMVVIIIAVIVIGAVASAMIFMQQAPGQPITPTTPLTTPRTTPQTTPTPVTTPGQAIVSKKDTLKVAIGTDLDSV